MLVTTLEVTLKLIVQYIYKTVHTNFVNGAKYISITIKIVLN